MKKYTVLSCLLLSTVVVSMELPQVADKFTVPDQSLYTRKRAHSLSAKGMKESSTRKKQETATPEMSADHERLLIILGPVVRTYMGLKPDDRKSKFFQRWISMVQKRAADLAIHPKGYASDDHLIDAVSMTPNNDYEMRVLLANSKSTQHAENYFAVVTMIKAAMTEELKNLAPSS